MKIQKEQNIKEEDKIHEQWYKKAKEQTPETIGNFVKKLANDYNHDYGTICHALASAAIGAAWAVDKGPQGGITGYQAGSIMWEFIKHWNYENNKCGLRILDYDNMLYPQYEKNYDKIISKHTWENLQIQAKSSLEKEKNSRLISTSVIEHWQSIVDGKVPFGYKVEEDD